MGIAGIILDDSRVVVIVVILLKIEASVLVDRFAWSGGVNDLLVVIKTLCYVVCGPPTSLAPSHR